MSDIMSATRCLRLHDLLQQMKGLGMAAGVRHIGAHSYDEDVGVMAYHSFKHRLLELLVRRLGK